MNNGYVGVTNLLKTVFKWDQLGEGKGLGYKLGRTSIYGKAISISKYSQGTLSD